MNHGVHGYKQITYKNRLTGRQALALLTTEFIMMHPNLRTGPSRKRPISKTVTTTHRATLSPLTGTLRPRWGVRPRAQDLTEGTRSLEYQATWSRLEDNREDAGSFTHH